MNVSRDDHRSLPEDPAQGSNAAARTDTRVGRRRSLTPADRLVRVPLGVLWLGVLAVVAVPVMAWMTLLHLIVRGGRRLRRAFLPRTARREPAD